MSDVLAEIIARKRADVAVWRRSTSIDALDRLGSAQSPPRGFAEALRNASLSPRFGLVSEIKKASPSHGLIRRDFDPPSIARAYGAAGACCLSVLTDLPYFQGQNSDLEAARESVGLPVLRKDFMIDPWQVAEARAIGADCILLIMAALGDAQASELERAAEERGLDVLIEVHDAAELDRALRLNSPLIGINNRNLKTLATSLETTIDLASRLPPERLGISESGIATHDDLSRLAATGIRCFLVGESLLRQPDMGLATKRLLGNAD